MLRVPTRAPAPTLTAPIRRTSPSSQWPLRSTSGSTEHPLPSDNHAGDRGERVQVDVLADLGAQQPGVRRQQRGTREVGGAELVREPLGQPQPQVGAAPTRVVTGRHAGAAASAHRVR